ncbi:hypothetical protein GFS03_11175 [Sulfolobus sp. E5-1-F]|uniref:hypothetical protein n=1 Tax=Sulfolobaceae TaxID=118883 RepID=UPI0012975140|nr:hypothetical protein GFS03_11175 [Sulfolobus sp. E5-1-F]QGA67905.1 hypothetical protein GFS33_02990 [Sulfolobus sp. E11-6]
MWDKKLPPTNKPPFEKLYDCESESCIQKLVDDYIYNLLTNNNNNNNYASFKLFKDDDDSDHKFILNEKVMLNSYLFIKVLLRRILETDLDFEYVVDDLEKKLGNTHPIVLFLKQFKDD